MAKPKKYRNTANPDMAQAMLDKRTSNAAGVHADKRSKRARTRAASLRRDLRDAA